MFFKNTIFLFLKIDNRKQFLITQRVFQFFCSKKHKIVLENNYQTYPKCFREHLLIVFTYFLRTKHNYSKMKNDKK